jgi:hypothetical protein
MMRQLYAPPGLVPFGMSRAQCSSKQITAMTMQRCKHVMRTFGIPGQQVLMQCETDPTVTSLPIFNIAADRKQGKASSCSYSWNTTAAITMPVLLQVVLLLAARACPAVLTSLKSRPIGHSTTVSST